MLKDDDGNFTYSSRVIMHETSFSKCHGIADFLGNTSYQSYN